MIKRLSSYRIFFQKNKRFTDSLVVTVIVFVFIGLFAKLPIGLGFLNPIGNSVKDFDIYDVVFSKFRSEQTADTNIVLVNIGDLDREGIARQLEIINDCSPKVIGLDLLFYTKKDRIKDSILERTIKKCKNIVLASRLDRYNIKNDSYDSLLSSEQLFKGKYSTGFANLPEEDAEGYRTIRRFRPYAKYKSSFETAFPVKIAELADKNSIRLLNQRNNDKELINYRGNLNKYFYLESMDPFKNPFNGQILKDKIVLIGFMGLDIKTKTFEDIFFTPLNERYAGRAFPDMYGVVINANIISMLIRNNYIEVMPGWLSFIIAVCLSLFSINMLLLIKRIYKDWFGAVYKLFIFLFTILDLSLGVFIFNNYTYKVNLTLTIVAIVIGPTCLDLYELFLRKRIFPKKKEKDEPSAQLSSISRPDVISRK
ncbi:MAG: CHASE2 domain-containing protein [Bacteroidota bacterium]|nr:CHASE2 domain-containing protein [Bacteroidota bacterium]MDP4189954.1 CHASE2 domain-containing protein [Bacteroidota bacterium]MDP4194489.1 CHASE2 domain-containing protein [Bacteroidota bacterium]